MRRFAQQRTLRNIGWQKIVKPWTSSDTIDRFKFAESSILKKKNFANKIPSKVEPIDWEYWNSAISAPGVVNELKKQYEEHVFEDKDVNTDVEGAQELEKEIFDLKVKSKVSEVELKSCDEVIKKAINLKADMVKWTHDQWLAYIPGLKEELTEEFDNEEYHISDEDERKCALDFGQMAKDVSKGKIDTLPFPKPERIGDLSLSEIEQHRADGTWTIATWGQPKAERERLYAERKKLLDNAKAELAKSVK